MHTNNKTYTGVPVWSEYVSQTEIPFFSESTSINGQKIIFESSIL